MTLVLKNCLEATFSISRKNIQIVIAIKFRGERKSDNPNQGRIQGEGVLDHPEALIFYRFMGTSF